MKHSHLQTPRTLAECQWTEGYPTHELRPTKLEALAGYAMACAMGAGLAVWLVFALS